MSFDDKLQLISSNLGIHESEEETIRKNNEVLQFGFPDGADLSFQNSELLTLNGEHDSSLDLVNAELQRSRIDGMRSQEIHVLNVDNNNRDFFE